MTIAANRADSAEEADLLRRQLEEVTDAYVAANDQLLSLYKLTEFSAVTLDRAVVVGRIVDVAQAVLQADRVRLISHSAENPDDITGDEPWIDFDPPTARSRLSVPVRSDAHFFGSIVAEAREHERFTTADLKLAGALANQLATVLELAQLHEASLERMIVERDYETASALARAVLKRSLPQVPELDLASLNRSARAAGGDFYAAGRSSTGLYVAVGDVSGKGLPAALIMMTALSATSDAFQLVPTGDAGAVLTAVDRQLSEYLMETGVFVTMAVAHIESATMRLEVSNAGQSPVALFQSGEKTAIPADGPPVGVLAPRMHRSSSWVLENDGMLFVGTDGWTDQEDPSGRMFGDDGIDAVLSERRARGAESVVNDLLQAVDTHAAGTDQADDLTALVVCRTDPEES